MDDAEAERIFFVVYQDKRELPVYMNVSDALLFRSVVVGAATLTGIGDKQRDAYRVAAGRFTVALLARDTRFAYITNGGQDFEQAKEILMDAVASRSDLEITVSVRDTWFMVCAAQVATRIPDLPESVAAVALLIGKQFQASVELEHPGAGAILELGWNPDYDY